MSTTAGCLGKLGYPTRAEADRVKRHLHAKPGYVRGDVLRPYHCTKYKKFHLGRSRRDGVRELRRTPDHERDSFKNRKSRYDELTK